MGFIQPDPVCTSSSTNFICPSSGINLEETSKAELDTTNFQNIPRNAY